jgi:hypothetical protein
MAAAREMFDFYVAEGIEEVCFNVEESEGDHVSRSFAESGVEAAYLGRPVLPRDFRLISGDAGLATLSSRYRLRRQPQLSASRGRCHSRPKRSSMTMDRKIAALAVRTGVLIAATAVHAQAPTALEQAELAGLSPEMRAQVQSRAVAGNSVTEVLQRMLLNNIKAKHPASQIVAMDWARG